MSDVLLSCYCEAFNCHDVEAMPARLTEDCCARAVAE